MKNYNNLRPSNIPVTLRQLTKSPYTQERKDDSGYIVCKAAKPYFEYDSTAKKWSTRQIGWTYQCKVPQQENAMVFVKVTDMNCVVTNKELAQGPVELTFMGFAGTWWLDKDGRFQLSCKAELAERKE